VVLIRATPGFDSRRYKKSTSPHSREHAQVVIRIERRIQPLVQELCIATVDKHVHVPVQLAMFVQQFSPEPWITADHLIHQLPDGGSLRKRKIDRFQADYLPECRVKIYFHL